MQPWVPHYRPGPFSGTHESHLYHTWFHWMLFCLYMYRFCVTVVHIFYSAPVGVQSIVINLFVCLSASISVEPLGRSSQNFVCRSPVAVARSSSGGVAIHYVLLVLWMTSCLPVLGSMEKCVGETVKQLLRVAL